MIKKRFISMLVLLAAVATGARAQWTGGTYTATATENLGTITVNGDATLTINSDVTVTVTGGINVASGTLTVTGPGTLEVTCGNGNSGYEGGTGGTGGTGGVAISGNIIVQGGATVTATGGTGGKGGDGNDQGGRGGNGGVAISGNIIVQGGATVTATGGTGGTGGNASEQGGYGGNGGNAFAGTLTYKSGTVTANGGSGGSNGSGRAFGNLGYAGNAFANEVDFTQTNGYIVTNGTIRIGSVLNQIKVVISGGHPTGSVSLKEGTDDATNWQGKAGTGEYQALPLEGVAAGTAVSVKYSGWKLVKSVKATKTAPTPALNLTSPAVGQVIGDDGKNYDYYWLPGGVTALAKICYVSGDHGLALALTDEGLMQWEAAVTTAAAHTPVFSNGTWRLPSKDEWDNMITAAGGYTDLRDGFSSVGGSNLRSDYYNSYWSSTEALSSGAWDYGFVGGNWGWDRKDNGDIMVRACLAF